MGGALGRHLRGEALQVGGRSWAKRCLLLGISLRRWRILDVTAWCARDRPRQPAIAKNIQDRHCDVGT